jgi:hypothetical protein
MLCRVAGPATHTRHQGFGGSGFSGSAVGGSAVGGSAFGDSVRRSVA